MTKPRSRWVWRAAGAAAIAFVLLCPFQVKVWDGGFQSAEFRLRFVDEQGQPVPDVRLEVFTLAGGRSPHYPVNEFRPGQAVKSDADGRVAFHHVGTSLEFGGRDYFNFLDITVSKMSSPRYDCAFFLDDREVYRTPYNDLSPHNFDLPRVEREWTFPEWTQQEWAAHNRDLNNDGALDREERIARGYVERFFDGRSTMARFNIVEKTIVIGRPR